MYNLEKHITSEWRVFNNVINVDIEPCKIRLHPKCVDAKDMVFGKHLICQKVIVPYMTYANNGILFTMKAIEMKLCRVVYGVRLHRLTRFETGTVRKTEVIAVTI